MSTQPPADSKVSEPRPPSCPKCNQQMPIVALFPYQIGSLILPSVQCPFCGVLLQMFIILPQQIPAEGEPPKSPLWKPS